MFWQVDDTPAQSDEKDEEESPETERSGGQEEDEVQHEEGGQPDDETSEPEKRDKDDTQVRRDSSIFYSSIGSWAGITPSATQLLRRCYAGGLLVLQPAKAH